MRSLCYRFDALNLPDNEKSDREKEDVERSHFVQELLLSMLTTDYTNFPGSNVNDQAIERAVPSDCPALISPVTNSEKHATTSSTTVKPDTADKNNEKHTRQKASSKQRAASESRHQSTTARSRPSDADVGITRVLQPPAGIPARNLYSSDHSSYDPEDDEKLSEDNDDQPPTPPRQHSIEIRLQNHIYSPVRLAGVSNSAPLTHYGREEVQASDNSGKHMR